MKVELFFGSAAFPARVVERSADLSAAALGNSHAIKETWNCAADLSAAVSFVMEDERQDLASNGAPPADAALCLGRQQAFGLVASRCTAAQVECLQTIRDQRHYQALGVTWEQFCRLYVGLGRSRADDLIRELEEFGPAYFRLSEIVRIPAQAYRQIAAHIQDGALNFQGCAIPIAQENAPRIRAAVAALRRQSAESKPGPESLEDRIENLGKRFDTLFEVARSLYRNSRNTFESTAVQLLLNRIADQAHHVATRH